MDAYNAIISKRDSRVYADQPIDDAVLRRVLQAGRMAGSSKNTQPVRLIVLRDKGWIQEVAGCGDYTQALSSAPVAVVVCCAPDGSDFDAGRTAQNMMVAAWSEGLSSCPMSLNNQPCAIEKLSLPQDVLGEETDRQGWRVVVIVAFGYPRPGVPVSVGWKRVDFDEFVHWEKWGGQR